MKFLPSFGEITQKAIHTFKRFPVTLMWAILGTLFTIWMVGADLPDDEKIPFIKVVLVASMGISWLIATRFLINYFKEVENKRKEWLMGVPILFLAWFYWYLPGDSTAFDNDMYGYKIALYFVIGHLLLLFSPFLFTWNKTAYWNYLKTVFISIVRSLLFSGVLYLGLNLALLALKFLFDIDFEELLFLKLFVFCAGIINTWIYLSDFPEQIHDNVAINYPKAMEVFVKYILIPLTVLYLVILYAYSIKIVLNWNLPKGWVSYLVIALSFLGVLIHVLINPVRKTINSRAIKLFYPWFYLLLLPMLGLLFVAISKRLLDYGITENRYIVCALACWITGVTLYILFSKKKQLRYVTISLATVLLLISFGFWGMFSVSERSQLNQFSELFTEMKATEFKISKTQNEQFKSIIRYLHDRKALVETEQVLGFNPESTFGDESSWSISSKIADRLGVVVIKDPNATSVKDTYHNYSISNDYTIDIDGYDYLIKWGDISKKSKVNDYSFYIDKKKLLLIIKLKGDKKHEINLRPLADSLLLQNTTYNVPPSKLIIEESFEDLELKLVFENVNFNSKEEIELRRGYLVMLLNIK